MKVEYLPSFLKDLKALKSTPGFEAINALVFEEIPRSTSLGEISSLKRLKGVDDAYRIRVGDYRIGLFTLKETITFARVLHRREIYRYFP
ncbi:plasmid stabilization protein [Phormidesmis priestleyi ULC007]|uniref:Plasmid stabilization protein n=1 Tax=Phormidesmis priestleyi ULC007 TaxID=1920490 RepID=A0A2T1DCZ7_9CYAN|nr:type II toxin-antitoxin system RelE/ParE family toxin [Phormidesmis priestleyi]PSB18323.1 plasmid stabilization protein [Phormidesmis priestleyi ULC007]PZO46521.1 MAG: plasmid stabilization protein [Phormidesmis priestleyi]